MSAQQLFRPADALVFRPLPEQFAVIHDLYKEYKSFEKYGYSPKEALYFSFVKTHTNKHGMATSIGAKEFYERMTWLLGVAQERVEYVIEHRFWPFRERLDSHNTVANCLDPIQMLEMAATDPGSSHLSRRRHFEAQRQLGIALQLFSIESVDREVWIPEDLGQIERLSWERLFIQDESKDIWTVSEIHTDPKMHGHTKHVWVVTSIAKNNKLTKKLRKRTAPFREDLFTCRVALVNGVRFYVYVINRRKRLLSTIVKLERGRPYTDRRGWKYVVVAVEDEHTVRVATNEDAFKFHEHTRKVLWKHPLVEEVNDTSPNPDSHDSYRDEKILGYFERQDEGRLIAGVAEQMVTAVGPHIDTLVATNRMNHFLYTSEKYLGYIAPLWFPYRRGPYDHMAHFRLPGYGVDWSKPYFQNQLRRWWQTKI